MSWQTSSLGLSDIDHGKQTQADAPGPPQPQQIIEVRQLGPVLPGPQYKRGRGRSFFRDPPRKGAVCQVPNCDKPLHKLRDYYKRYKICPFHLELPCLVVEGQSIRFCQQCGRYQLLSDFDGDRRSCRKKLVKHNARRRKADQPGDDPANTQDVEGGSGSMQRQGWPISDLASSGLAVDRATGRIQGVAAHPHCNKFLRLCEAGPDVGAGNGSSIAGGSAGDATLATSPSFANVLGKLAEDNELQRQLAPNLLQGLSDLAASAGRAPAGPPSGSDWMAEAAPAGGLPSPTYHAALQQPHPHPVQQQARLPPQKGMAALRGLGARQAAELLPPHVVQAARAAAAAMGGDFFSGLEALKWNGQREHGEGMNPSLLLPYFQQEQQAAEQPTGLLSFSQSSLPCNGSGTPGNAGPSYGVKPETALKSVFLDAHQQAEDAEVAQGSVVLRVMEGLGQEQANECTPMSGVQGGGVGGTPREQEPAQRSMSVDQSGRTETALEARPTGSPAGGVRGPAPARQGKGEAEGEGGHQGCGATAGAGASAERGPATRKLPSRQQQQAERTAAEDRDFPHEHPSPDRRLQHAGTPTPKGGDAPMQDSSLARLAGERPGARQDQAPDQEPGSYQQELPSLQLLGGQEPSTARMPASSLREASNEGKAASAVHSVGAGVHSPPPSVAERPMLFHQQWDSARKVFAAKSAFTRVAPSQPTPQHSRQARGAGSADRHSHPSQLRRQHSLGSTAAQGPASGGAGRAQPPHHGAFLTQHWGSAQHQLHGDGRAASLPDPAAPGFGPPNVSQPHHLPPDLLALREASLGSRQTVGLLSSPAALRGERVESDIAARPPSQWGAGPPPGPLPVRRHRGDMVAQPSHGFGGLQPGNRAEESAHFAPSAWSGLPAEPSLRYEQMYGYPAPGAGRNLQGFGGMDAVAVQDQHLQQQHPWGQLYSQQSVLGPYLPPRPAGPYAQPLEAPWPSDPAALQRPPMPPVPPPSTLDIALYLVQAAATEANPAQAAQRLLMQQGPWAVSSSMVMEAMELLQQVMGAGGAYQPSQKLTTVSMKLYKCTPEQLPPNTRSQLEAWMASSRTPLEDSIRPGCVHLTATALLDASEQGRLASDFVARVQGLVAGGGSGTGLGTAAAERLMAQCGQHAAVLEGGRIVARFDLGQAGARGLAPALTRVQPLAVAPDYAQSFMLMGSRLSEHSTEVFCRHMGRYPLLAVLSRGPSSSCTPADPQKKKASPGAEWVELEVLEPLQMGAYQVEAQAGQFVSPSQLAFLVLPDRQAVEEVRQLEEDGGGFGDVPGFVQQVGMVLQYLQATGTLRPAPMDPRPPGSCPEAGQPNSPASTAARPQCSFLRMLGVGYTLGAPGLPASPSQSLGLGAAQGGAVATVPPLQAQYLDPGVARRVAASAQELAGMCVARGWPALLRLLLPGVTGNGAATPADAVRGMGARCGRGGTVLHAAVAARNVQVVRALGEWGREAGHQWEVAPRCEGAGRISPLHLLALLDDCGELAMAMTDLAPRGLEDWLATPADGHPAPPPLFLAGQLGNWKLLQALAAAGLPAARIMLCSLDPSAGSGPSPPLPSCTAGESAVALCHARSSGERRDASEGGLDHSSMDSVDSSGVEDLSGSATPTSVIHRRYRRKSPGCSPGPQRECEGEGCVHGEGVGGEERGGGSFPWPPATPDYARSPANRGSLRVRVPRRGGGRLGGLLQTGRAGHGEGGPQRTPRESSMDLPAQVMRSPPSATEARCGGRRKGRGPCQKGGGAWGQQGLPPLTAWTPWRMLTQPGMLRFASPQLERRFAGFFAREMCKLDALACLLLMLLHCVWCWTWAWGEEAGGALRTFWVLAAATAAACTPPALLLLVWGLRGSRRRRYARSRDSIMLASQVCALLWLWLTWGGGAWGRAQHALLPGLAWLPASFVQRQAQAAHSVPVAAAASLASALQLLPQACPAGHAALPRLACTAAMLLRVGTLGVALPLYLLALLELRIRHAYQNYQPLLKRQ